MNILSGITLSLYLLSAPPQVAPLTQAVANDWEPTGSSLVIIERVAEDGQTYKVAYSSRLIPCGSETPGDKVFIILKSSPEGAPPACYLVYKEAVGYLEDGGLKPMVQKTWPPAGFSSEPGPTCPITEEEVCNGENEEI